ncbi:MAG: class I tRNA ligase family protein, partial [Bacteroidota bacterium]
MTGWDIIFLWVARMIMAGYEWKNEKPFEAVYFTGMVRDKKGRKMSKSLGNSPDALELIEKFGADGVRFGILSSSPAGGDLLFDDSLCDQGSRFCNKIWHAKNLVNGWTVDANEEASALDKLSVEWFDNLLSQKLKQIERSFKSYRLSEALMDLYKFVWGDFCSYYLEMIKPTDGKVDQVTYDKTIEFFEKICTVLHPYMPFLTEDIWHYLKERAAGDDCIISSYPKAGEVNEQLIRDIEIAQEIISKIRDVKQKNKIKPKELVDFAIQKSDKVEHFIANAGIKDMVSKLASLKSFELTDQEIENVVSFNADVFNCFVLVEQEIDV